MTLHEFFTIVGTKWAFWSWLLEYKVQLFQDFSLSIEEILLGILGIIVSTYIITTIIDTDIAFIFRVFGNDD